MNLLPPGDAVQPQRTPKPRKVVVPRLVCDRCRQEFSSLSEMIHHDDACRTANPPPKTTLRDRFPEVYPPDTATHEPAASDPATDPPETPAIAPTNGE